MPSLLILLIPVARKSTMARITETSSSQKKEEKVR